MVVGDILPSRDLKKHTPPYFFWETSVPELFRSGSHSDYPKSVEDYGSDFPNRSLYLGPKNSNVVLELRLTALLSLFPGKNGSGY